MKKASIMLKRTVAAIGATALMFAMATGCTSNKAPVNNGGDDKKPASTAQNTQQAAKPSEPLKLSIMTVLINPEPPKADNPVQKAIEEYTNTKLDITWVPSANYDDKVNITIASGETPMAMLVTANKSASIVNAVKSGAFWELGPYYKDAANLSKANPIALNNISVGGKVYGIYRARALGRNGIVYRKDWLENLGLKEPKTIDDFYNMLKAFTKNDPDKNGKDDTYGMVVWKGSATGAPGSWGIVLSWFGGPNQWAEDKDGKLVPSHLTPEYMQALNFYKRLYDEKLINQDFAVMEMTKARELFEKNGAGSFLNTMDDSVGRVANMEKTNPNVKVDVMSAVEGPKGLRTPATSGYAGVYMIPKGKVKTEAEVKQIMKFFDQMCDKKMQDTLTWGIEGRIYQIENGKPKIIDAKLEIDELGPFKQFGIGVPSNYTPGVVTPMRQRADEVIAQTEKIALANPCEPFISQTHTQKGPQLDTMIEDARIKYIMGQINEAGFKAVLEQWRKGGGDDIVKEMNDEYAKSKQK